MDLFMQSWLTVWCMIFFSLPALAQPFDPSSAGRMAISRNGKRIAVASEDKRVRVWDLDTYDLLFQIELPEPGLSVALDQTGQELLVGTHGNRQSANEYMRSKIGLWNLAANEPVQVWETQVIGGCQGLAFAPKSDFWRRSASIHASVSLTKKMASYVACGSKTGTGFGIWISIPVNRYWLQRGSKLDSGTLQRMSYRKRLCQRITGAKRKTAKHFRSSLRIRVGPM